MALSEIERVSLDASIEWVYSTLRAEQVLKLGASRTHSDLAFHSAILNQGRKERQEMTAKCTSTKKLKVHHVDKPGSLKYGRFQELLGTLIGWIAAAIRLKKTNVQKLRIPNMGGNFLIRGKYRAPGTGPTILGIAGGRFPGSSSFSMSGRCA